MFSRNAHEHWHNIPSKGLCLLVGKKAEYILKEHCIMCLQNKRIAIVNTDEEPFAFTSMHIYAFLCKHKV